MGVYGQLIFSLWELGNSLSVSSGIFWLGQSTVIQNQKEKKVLSSYLKSKSQAKSIIRSYLKFQSKADLLVDWSE